MVTEDRLAAIESRLAAATPGPWFAYRDGLAAFIREADLTVIANAPTDLADLVAEVRRLQSELADPHRPTLGPVTIIQPKAGW